jgi:hypothetical protein
LTEVTTLLVVDQDWGSHWQSVLSMVDQECCIYFVDGKPGGGCWRQKCLQRLGSGFWGYREEEVLRAEMLAMRSLRRGVALCNISSIEEELIY